MGKKATKRKTQWRILSITECPPQHLKSALTKQYSADKNNVNITSTTETNNNEGVISQDDDCSNHESSYSNPTYLKRKSSTASNYRNDYRNNSRYNYNNKHNSASSTSSLHSSSRYTSYRRRPFSSLQNGTSRYSYYGAERTTSRGYRSTQSSVSLNRDATDSTKKLHFNEDDYTRISTPRQDVIFKKGCFSQPKKYVSSTDTNTTSSAAASIVSAEESVSALSLPSLSPEQCSSIADSLDPEQGFVYSFIDQNGVVYSYVPNSFDQYNGQMMMLPYGYPPYLCSPDETSPTGLNEETEETRTSVESQEIPSSDLDETKVIDEVPMDASTSMAASEETLKTQENDDNKECETPSKEATVATDEVTTAVAEDADETKENDEIPDTVQNIPGQFYNYGYPPYYPAPILYPYMLPQQFVPLYGNEFDIPVEEDFNEDIEDQNRKSYRCRKKRRNTDGNSTGVSAATTDYSEDESEDEEGSECHEECRNIVDQQTTIDVRDLQSQSNETENKTSLNVDVEEFIPRGIIKSSLNVNVQEFHPRNTKESTSSNQSNENSLKERTASSAGSTSLQNLANVTSSAQNQYNVVEKKRTELTLAEKIKMRLAEEANSVPIQKVDITQNPLPQRRNAKRQTTPQTKNTGGRKKPERVAKDNLNLTDVRKSPESRSAPQPAQPSYAQIATTGVKEKEKSPMKVESVVKNRDIEEDKQTPSKEVPTESVSKTSALANKVSLTAVENETPDSWQTVKPKGKRGKHTKEQPKEEIIRDKLRSEVVPQHVPLVQEPEPIPLKTPQTAPPEAKLSILPEVDTAQTVAPESSVVTSAAPKKTPKPKHRKNAKKTPDSSTKKKKKFEIIEPVFELPKTEKPISKKSIQPALAELASAAIDNKKVDANDIEDLSNLESEDQEEMQFPSGDGKFSFDRLYLGKGFGRNPLDILKGFDYKFKPKSILKEEEEMVLSVIKSLNNSTSPSPPKVSPTTSVIDDDDSDEKTIEDTVKDDAQDSGSDTDTVSDLSINGSGECKEEADHHDEPEMITQSQEVAHCNPKLSESLGDSCSKAIFAVSSNTDYEELTCISNKSNEQTDKSTELNNDVINSIADLQDSTTSESSADTPEELSENTHEPKYTETASSLSQTTEILVIQNDILDKEIISIDSSNSDGQNQLQPVPEPLVEKLNGCEKDITEITNQEKVIKDEIYAENLSQPLEKENIQNIDSHLSKRENHLTNGDLCNLNKLLVKGDIENDNEQIKRVNHENLTNIEKNQLNEANIDDDLTLVRNPCETKVSKEATNKCNGFLCNQNAEDIKSEHFSNGTFAFLETCNQSEDIILNITQNGHLMDCKDETKNDELNDFEIESLTKLNKFTPTIFPTNGVHDVLESTLPSSPVLEPAECMPRSLTQSPFELKEKLFEDLNGISVPKVEADLLNGSKDFVACVNALHTIIKSRECSVEPSRSRDTSLEPGQLTKTSIELNLYQDCSKYENNDRAALVQPNMSSSEAADFKECIDSLHKLIKNRECSMESNHVSNISTNNVSAQNGYSTENAFGEPKSLNGSARSSTYDSFERTLKKTQLEATDQNDVNEKTANQSELIPKKNTIDPLTSTPDSDLNFDLVGKESSRTFKTSISCDHSSGIGSDCEDNQPTSPGRIHQSAAQTEEDASIKPFFPINTSLSNDAQSPQITTMPINVLPSLSQTNSATCDNQSVSYTSSKSLLTENINPSLNTTSRLSDEANDDPNLELSVSSKFPHQEECETSRFPLTAAVKQWLIQESKESTPEPILRIPDDLSLKTLLERKIQSINFVDEREWSSTEESDDERPDDDENEYEEDEADYLQKHRTKPKNLKSNPLHVSFCNALTIDTDSDYNSDSNDHHCTERIDDNTGKRVAENLSDKKENVTDKNDLLEFWDDEFVSNPRKWLVSSKSVLGSSSDSSTATLATREKRSPSTDPEPYVSVYGQTIDYKQLQANKYESLSNNILSVNKSSKTSADVKSSNNYQAVIEQTQQSEIPLGSNNNFYNDNDKNKCNAVKNVNTTPTATATRNPAQTNTENCLKPPEVCCILM